MKKFLFNKLVRDKIPSLMSEHGEIVETDFISDRDLMSELFVKLEEEKIELMSGEEVELDSVIDLLEVVRCIGLARGFSDEQIEEAQLEKREKYGSVIGKHFVKTVEVPEGNEWFDYLSQNPDRYPEVS